MPVRNVHERVLPVPAAVAGALLDRLASPGDPLWPSPPWPRLRFDRPLGVGATGGHGPIRYRVTRYTPGRLIECAFDPATGCHGTHAFEVEPLGAGRCVLRHRLTARTTGAMRLLWPLAIRVCHDTLLEHLLDNAERATTGAVRRPVRYPLRARLAAPAVRAVRVPPGAHLLHAWPGRRDLADAYAVHVPPGVPADPQAWADAVFRDPPRPVALLLGLRNLLAPLVGVARADATAFATLARTDREVLLGTDAAHLGFRAGVLVTPGATGATVTVSTVAAARGRAGRAYLAVVRLVHPAVVRAMLRRAARTTVRSAGQPAGTITVRADTGDGPAAL
ncbi:DUF2867 domain-containing protein [Spirilliplanes yamanashiensis]|uniref:DUF2867 domain-containing protein n=1 Tax=Spirilliplanes yamanashiensis TaxID=42233 RepID=A0A8J4DJM2_9ACTN|nr:DUF2867 domain-containing protein [Spirilliplanes yamanashiensis]MDP9815732.1 hypothetical protein [Spirilliplanes yamanashiensis]GIJ03986.1 hypothetical protein Sya03_33380 [Spirilliplanes yamanashiensis]